HHRVFVERSDTARQLHSADQIDRNVVPFLSCRVEEGILNVLLCRLGFHMPISFLFGFELRREHLGDRRQLCSCRLLQYGLASRFSTCYARIFCGQFGLRARPASVCVRFQTEIGVHFRRPPSTINTTTDCRIGALNVPTSTFPPTSTPTFSCCSAGCISSVASPGWACCISLTS